MLAEETGDGGTLLGLAAVQDHPAAAAALIAAGVPVDQPNRDGASPAWEAASWGHSAVLSVLLDAGADQSIRCFGVTVAGLISGKQRRF